MNENGPWQPDLQYGGGAGGLSVGRGESDGEEGMTAEYGDKSVAGSMEAWKDAWRSPTYRFTHTVTTARDHCCLRVRETALIVVSV